MRAGANNNTRLGDNRLMTLRVRDLMTTESVTLKATDTIKQATIKLAVDNVSSAPVIDARSHVVGILSENDILALIMKHQTELAKRGDQFLLGEEMDSLESVPEVLEINRAISATKVDEVMKRAVLTTTPDATIIEALKAMMTLDVARLPVLEKGVLIGTISRSDIIFYVYKRKA